MKYRYYEDKKLEKLIIDSTSEENNFIKILPDFSYIVDCKNYNLLNIKKFNFFNNISLKIWNSIKLLITSKTSKCPICLENCKIPICTFCYHSVCFRCLVKQKEFNILNCVVCGVNMIENESKLILIDPFIDKILKEESLNDFCDAKFDFSSDLKIYTEKDIYIQLEVVRNKNLFKKMFYFNFSFNELINITKNSKNFNKLYLIKNFPINLNLLEMYKNINFIELNKFEAKEKEIFKNKLKMIEILTDKIKFKEIIKNISEFLLKNGCTNEKNQNRLEFQYYNISKCKILNPLANYFINSSMVKNREIDVLKDIVSVSCIEKFLRKEKVFDLYKNLYEYSIYRNKNSGKFSVLGCEVENNNKKEMVLQRFDKTNKNNINLEIIKLFICYFLNI